MQVYPGKIKWFSREQHLGVVMAISGESLFFTHAVEGAADFTEGELVGYSNLGHGRLGLRAGNVHGLRPRASDPPAPSDTRLNGGPRPVGPAGLEPATSRL